MLSVKQRLWLLNGLVVLMLAGLFVRMIDLQVLRNGYFEAVAASQRKRAAELAPTRGTIYVQEKEKDELFPVAVNKKSWIAYAVPRDMEDPLRVAEKLAPELYEFRQRQEERVKTILKSTGQSPREGKEEEEKEEKSKEEKIAVLRDELYRKFDKRADPYEPFLKFYEVLDDEFYNFLNDNELSGVRLEETKKRVYPEKTLAAHVLGYVGWEDEEKIGRYGVEGHVDDDLSGEIGFFSIEKDAVGRQIGVGEREFEAAEDGADVVLTIDRVIQSMIEEELKKGVEKYSAERGSILVMNPQTGAVLGMATYPTYDPNYYYAINEPRVQLNPIVSDIFEPGSVLKPVIMAAAVNEGLITPNTTFNDTGPVSVADYTINTFDGKHHGVQTMTQVLEQSNNVGMVWVGQKLGAETMYDYLRRFGLGERTGIGLEGETRSTLKEPGDWDVTTVATTAFGQGIAMTPLQSLNAINALANDGVLTQPHVISRIRQGNGEEEVNDPTQVRQVVSPRTAADLSAMMVSVIENGVAGLARVPGYYLAGKTGTAQVPDERGRYSKDRKIISFVGFGPIDDPKFSIMVKLDNPAGLSFASGTAAPMFRNVAEKLINYLQVPPDYDTDKKNPKFRVSDEEGEGV